MSTPKINVTPLIDVLLVLLIIFMVISPLKPSAFKARVPSESQLTDPRVVPNPNTLVVSIGNDLSLSVNDRKNLGTPADSERLTQELASIFRERAERFDVDEQGNFVKVVFVKAPRNVAYGNVVKVIDAVKLAGAEPLSLQVDRLD
jgi:biopolymer transport protein ExbD